MFQLTCLKSSQVCRTAGLDPLHEDGFNRLLEAGGLTVIILTQTKLRLDKTNRVNETFWDGNVATFNKHFISDWGSVSCRWHYWSRMRGSCDCILALPKCLILYKVSKVVGEKYENVVMVNKLTSGG